MDVILGDESPNSRPDVATAGDGSWSRSLGTVSHTLGLLAQHRRRGAMDSSRLTRSMSESGRRRTVEPIEGRAPPGL